MSLKDRETQNRRDHRRMCIAAELQFEIAGFRRRHVGRTRNFSATGILFETAQAVAAGQVLKVTIPPANDTLPPLCAQVRVIRVDEETPGLYVVAGEMGEVR